MVTLTPCTVYRLGWQVLYCTIPYEFRRVKLSCLAQSCITLPSSPPSLPHYTTPTTTTTTTHDQTRDFAMDRIDRGAGIPLGGGPGYGGGTCVVLWRGKGRITAEGVGRGQLYLKQRG